MDDKRCTCSELLGVSARSAFFAAHPVVEARLPPSKDRDSVYQKQSVCSASVCLGALIVPCHPEVL